MEGTEVNEIPYLAFSKQAVLAVFTLVFTLMALEVWTSDDNKHSDMALSEGEGEIDHG
jgi:hypothetical protein